MSLRKSVLGVGLFVVLTAVVMAEGIDSDWNDFLHYTAIGRFDLVWWLGMFSCTW